MLSSVIAELKNSREVQKHKALFVYSVSAAVPNNTDRTVTLQIEKDGDFQCEKITGHIIAPASELGVRQASAPTDYPLVGTTVGWAEHGLSVKITDTSDRPLTSGFIPMELLLTPGYREQFYVPMPFKYLFPAASRVKLEFKNRDTQTDGGGPLYHYVSIALIGYKYAVSANQLG